MFAAGRSAQVARGQEGSTATGEQDGDNASWLRVGRSFQHDEKETTREKPTGESDADKSLALQAYKPRKTKQHPLKNDRKTSKKKKKKQKKDTKASKTDRTRSRRSRSSDSSSSTLSSWDNADEGHNRRHDGSRERSWDRGRYASQHKRRRHDSSDEDRRRPHSERRVSRHRRIRHDDGIMDDRSEGEVSIVTKGDRSDDGALEVYEASALRNEDKLYEFDCVGDRDNKFYGTLYAHDKPQYHLATRRSVMDGAWIVPRVTQKPQGGEDKKTPTTMAESRYFGPQARKQERKLGMRRLHMAYSERRQRQRRVEDTELTYIPLDPILVGEIVDGEHLQGDGGPEGEHEEGNDGNAGLLRTDLENIEQYLVTRNKSLNESVTAHPKSIDTWLDLIAFQEQSQRLMRQSSGAVIDGEDVVLTKQKAVLAKALEQNPKSRVLLRLKINLMLRQLMKQRRYGGGNLGRTSDTDLYKGHIESLLETDPSNEDLWLALLGFTQQKFSEFSVPVLRDLFGRILAILGKQAVRLMNQESPDGTRPQPQSSGNSFIRVFGKSSLLDVRTDPLDADNISSDVLHIYRAMLRFHSLMVEAECRAGFQERAVAHLQALVTFNTMRLDPSTRTSPSQVSQIFVSKWNDDSARMGESASIAADSPLSDLDCIPLAGNFREWANHQSHGWVDAVNPPAVIRSADHAASIISAYVFDSDIMQSTEGEFDFRNDTTTDGDGRGRWIYSNLHGQRIWVDDADDALEYERILGELRGTEESLARQEISQKRSQKKLEARDAMIAKQKDQRMDYPDLTSGQDVMVQWVVDELHASIVQWCPLQPSNPEHEAMIVEQPDRAILTEELQPFLFCVPRVLRLQIAVNLLHVMGVHLTSDLYTGVRDEEDSTGQYDAFYHDDFGSAETGEQRAVFKDKWDPLLAPILSAMDPASAISISLRSAADHVMIVRGGIFPSIHVSTCAATDPSRVTFIRNIFMALLALLTPSAINSFVPAERQNESISAIKRLWIEYETAVLLHVKTEDSNFAATMVRTRALCQQLMQSGTASNSSLATPSSVPEVNLEVMYAYAKMELALGNDRHVARICEKTISSLSSVSSTPDFSVSSTQSRRRSLHRFVFLGVRLEMWPKFNTDGKVKEASRSRPQRVSLSSSGEMWKLRLLYMLWQVWHPEADSIDRVTKQYRKQPLVLAQALRHAMVGDSESLCTVSDAVVERYRLELEMAVEGCLRSSNRRGGIPNDTGLEMATGGGTCAVAYCLHNLCATLYVTHGFEAARHEYQHFLNNDPRGSSIACHARLGWLMYLEFMQAHHACTDRSPYLAPRAWRVAIAQAVATFPRDALLLRLFVDAETSNTMSQTLRKYFHDVKQRWRRHMDSPHVVEWLFVLLCELSRVERGMLKLSQAVCDEPVSIPTCCLVHRWGGNAPAVERIRRVFEEMVEQVRTQGNALCWRLYVRFELAMGKVDAARKVFYRGLSKCPWSKALYLDGIRVLRVYLSEDECREIVEFMAAKELHIRVDT